MHRAPISQIDSTIIPFEVRQIMMAIEDAGGHPWIVGGFIRNILIRSIHPSIPCEIDFKDIDLEVFDLEPEAVFAIVRPLVPHCQMDVGNQFPVIKARTHSGIELDVAAPRRERKTGAGHRGFTVTVDVHMPLAEAARRRDFRMNAIALDLCGTIADPMDGMADIVHQVIRVCDPAGFHEDPNRVPRAMQFASRFDFAPDAECIAAAAAAIGEAPRIPAEIWWGEWEKWASKGVRPSRGLLFLRACGWIGLFPEAAALIGTAQDPEWHPEGDVWTHSCLSADRAAEIAARDGITGRARAAFVIGCFAHDFGKAEPGVSFVKDGRIVSPGHDEAGVAPATRFLNRINAPHAVRDQVIACVRHHMAHVGVEPSQRIVNRWAKRFHPASIQEIARVAEADHCARPPLPGGAPMAPFVALAESEGVAHQRPKRIIEGGRIIEIFGIAPGPQVGMIVRAAEQAQIEDRAFSDEAGAIQWIANQFDLALVTP